MPNYFQVDVELGDGCGVVSGDLPALFTNSELLTVRYPLPFSLEAESMQGVVKVVATGNGLLEGDVLRACSTPELRYDTSQKRVCMGAGFRGQSRQPSSASAVGESWIGALFERASAELGAFRQTRPTKVLFIADGRPYQQVTDALMANTLDRGVDDIVMLFERPRKARATSGVDVHRDSPAAFVRRPSMAKSRDDQRAAHKKDNVLLGSLLEALGTEPSPAKRGANKRRRKG